jgi:hypothetical protein
LARLGLTALPRHTASRLIPERVLRQPLLDRREARTVARIIERPAFFVSHDSQMVSLADIPVYNMYRQFRENDPAYLYFVRLWPQLIELIRLPENKEPPETGGSG